MQFFSIFSIALGSALGGILRYLISQWIPSNPGQFPKSTFLINLAGSFLLGLIMAYSLKNDMNTPVKLFFTIGFCGGFTTFSTFSWESLQLIQNDAWGTALVYITGSVFGGILLAWFGYKCI